MINIFSYGNVTDYNYYRPRASTEFISCTIYRIEGDFIKSSDLFMKRRWFRRIDY